jgi:hypothetical protein
MTHQGSVTRIRRPSIGERRITASRFNLLPQFRVGLWTHPLAAARAGGDCLKDRCRRRWIRYTQHSRQFVHTASDCF